MCKFYQKATRFWFLDISNVSTFNKSSGLNENCSGNLRKGIQTANNTEGFGSLEYRGFVAVAMTRHVLLEE